MASRELPDNPPTSEEGAVALSIVLPVYNEGDSIAAVFDSISQKIGTPHEILVVFDFDEDDTLPVVRELMSQVDSIRLIRNHLGRGALNAIRAGFISSTGRHVLVTMADGSDDHSSVDAMVRLADDGAAVVAASRYIPGGAQVGGPKLKALASRAAGLLLHFVAGLPIHDPTNNYKLYRNDFLHSVAIESTRGFELALELTVKAHLAGLPIREVPTVWKDRSTGTSQFRYGKLLPGYLRWFALGMSALVRKPKSRAHTAQPSLRPYEPIPMSEG